MVDIGGSQKTEHRARDGGARWTQMHRKSQRERQTDLK